MKIRCKFKGIIKSKRKDKIYIHLLGKILFRYKINPLSNKINKGKYGNRIKKHISAGNKINI
jgi:hypothetical protein